MLKRWRELCYGSIFLIWFFLKITVKCFDIIVWCWKARKWWTTNLNWSILDLVSRGKFFNLPEQDFLDTACLYSKITSEIFINYFDSYVQYTEKYFQSISSILKTQCFLPVTDKVMLNQVLRLNQIYLFLILKFQQVSYYWCSTQWFWSFHKNSDSIFIHVFKIISI